MQLTIVRPDNVVLINGRGIKLDLSRFPYLKGVHAVQWDGEKGHVEYDNRQTKEYRANENLMDIMQYETVIEAWKQAAAKEDEKPRPKEPPNALSHPQASPNHGGSSPRSEVRQESGYTTVRGERVQPSGRQDRNPSKEEETIKRRM